MYAVVEKRLWEGKREDREGPGVAISKTADVADVADIQSVGRGA
jgi:hypothetical protein